MGGSEMNGKLGERAAPNKRVKIADISGSAVSAHPVCYTLELAQHYFLEAQPKPHALQSSTERPTRNPANKAAVKPTGYALP